MDKYFAANAALSIFAKNYMELKKGLPVRPSEMGVLNIITETDGPHTPVMLAELLCVSKPMITAHITSLVSGGYVKKEPSKDDKRACYIIPTKKGTELVRRARNDLNKKLDRLIGGLGEDGFNDLVALCRKANAVMEKEKGE